MCRPAFTNRIIPQNGLQRRWIGRSAGDTDEDTRLRAMMSIELGGTRFRASRTCRSMSLHSLVSYLCVKKVRHFVLHAFEFVQTQLRVPHDKDIAVVAMFVDEEAITFGIFRAHLLQHTFALEHYGKDETGVRGRISFHDQAPEKLLGVFFRERFRSSWRCGFEFRFPK